MKTVVTGMAVAGMLALAMPAWAQGADANQPAAPAAGANQPTAPAAGVSTSHGKKTHGGMTGRKTSHHGTHHAAMQHRAGKHYTANSRTEHRTTMARSGSSSPTDNVANRLNAAEVQRNGSTEPPMGNPSMAPMGAPNQPIQGQ